MASWKNRKEGESEADWQARVARNQEHARAALVEANRVLKALNTAKAEGLVPQDARLSEIKAKDAQFGEVILGVFNRKEMRKKLEEYAEKMPRRFLERFWAPIAIPIAIKQNQGVEPEEKDAGTDRAMGLLDQVEKQWVERKNVPEGDKGEPRVPAVLAGPGPEGQGAPD